VKFARPPTRSKTALAALLGAATLFRMPRQIPNQLTFRLERLVLRGPQYRLLIIAALIGLLSLMGGAIIHAFDANFPGGFGEAVWWSFLRLSDPGYLGDDRGTLERTVSTVLTVLGYVVFLGALVAIMTQWLNARMRDLEAGLTPIALRDHVLVVGWTNRTPTIVRELVMSGSRVRRFLRLHGARSLRMAILADEVTTALRVELRERLGALWDERQIILRTGSPLRLEHLQRVAFMHASAVIMPAADFGSGGPDQADSRAIKTLLSMTNHPGSRASASLPLAVVEIFDSRKIDVARNAYGGAIEILASDAIISRLLAQNVRHPGLSGIFGELLTHGRGSEIYIRDCGELEGLRFFEAARSFPGAILLGLVRPDGASFEPQLNPSWDTVLTAEHRLALLAHSYEGTTPLEPVRPEAPPAAVSASMNRQPESRRVLVLGWSHKVPALLAELDSYPGESFHVDVISTTPGAKRERALARFDYAPKRITTNHIEADFTTRSVLERAGAASYDNIVLIGSDRLGSGEESDARSLLGYLQLREMLPPQNGPHVLVELLDAGNMSLFRKRRGEVIVTPLVLSHMMAQVALRRELRAVFDELFGPGGAEIVFRPASDYNLAGTSATFRRLESAAAEHGEIALGVRLADSKLATGGTLNPPREREFALGPGDVIVVLATTS
jgi:ion channel POLLUX/CASTOR